MRTPKNPLTMTNKLKIGAWNLCLGLFHNRDCVKTLLLGHQIDIFNLQKAEIQSNMDAKVVSISGYTIEIENGTGKKELPRMSKMESNTREEILLNQMCVLNNKIDKSWLSLRIDTFKVKCKDLFLSQ